jgi:hypothetical protein
LIGGNKRESGRSIKERLTCDYHSGPTAVAVLGRSRCSPLNSNSAAATAAAADIAPSSCGREIVQDNVNLLSRGLSLLFPAFILAQPTIHFSWISRTINSFFAEGTPNDQRGGHGLSFRNVLFSTTSSKFFSVTVLVVVQKLIFFSAFFPLQAVSSCSSSSIILTS